MVDRGFIQSSAELEGLDFVDDLTVAQAFEIFMKRKTSAEEGVGEGSLSTYTKARDQWDYIPIQTDAKGPYPTQTVLSNVKMKDLGNKQVLIGMANYILKATNMQPHQHLGWGPSTLQAMYNQLPVLDKLSGNLFADHIKTLMGPGRYEAKVGKALGMMTIEVKFPPDTAERFVNAITKLEEIQHVLETGDTKLINQDNLINVPGGKGGTLVSYAGKYKAEALRRVMDAKHSLMLQGFMGFRAADLTEMTVGQIKHHLSDVVDPTKNFKMLKYISKGKDQVTKVTKRVPRARPIIPEMEAIFRERLDFLGDVPDDTLLFKDMKSTTTTVNKILYHAFGDAYLPVLRPGTLKDTPLGKFVNERFTQKMLRHWMETRLAATGMPLQDREWFMGRVHLEAGRMSNVYAADQGTLLGAREAGLLANNVIVEQLNFEYNPKKETWVDKPDQDKVLSVADLFARAGSNIVVDETQPRPGVTERILADSLKTLVGDSQEEPLIIDGQYNDQGLLIEGSTVDVTPISREPRKEIAEARDDVLSHIKDQFPRILEEDGRYISGFDPTFWGKIFKTPDVFQDALRRAELLPPNPDDRTFLDLTKLSNDYMEYTNPGDLSDVQIKRGLIDADQQAKTHDLLNKPPEPDRITGVPDTVFKQSGSEILGDLVDEFSEAIETGELPPQETLLLGPPTTPVTEPMSTVVADQRSPLTDAAALLPGGIERIETQLDDLRRGPPGSSPDALRLEGKGSAQQIATATPTKTDVTIKPGTSVGFLQGIEKAWGEVPRGIKTLFPIAGTYYGIQRVIDETNKDKLKYDKLGKPWPLINQMKFAGQVIEEATTGNLLSTSDAEAFYKYMKKNITLDPKGGLPTWGKTKEPIGVPAAAMGNIQSFNKGLGLGPLPSTKQTPSSFAATKRPPIVTERDSWFKKYLNYPGILGFASDENRSK